MTHREQAQPLAARIWLWVLGTALTLAGLFFLIGGGKLISLGGSWYFALAGIGLLAAGVQTVRRQRSGAWLYLLTFAATVVWALCEVGLDYWSLISRLLALTFGAVVVLASMPLLRQGGVPAGSRAKAPLATAGVLLIAAEVLKPKQPRAVGIDDMTYRQAFVIGCFQCLALWPGFSRSGATISGGMLMGVSRYAASEFSFLLAVPMMMGATVLDVYKSIGFLNMGDVPMFAVGFVMAFIVALIAIKTFLQLIKRISFIPFAIYRFIVAAAVYVVFF